MAASDASEAARKAARWLQTPQAIRARCGAIYAAAEAGQLTHFRLRPARLDGAADYVLAVMRDNYPDLAVPVHSRWRHFSAGGRDRWAELRAGLAVGACELGRIRTELAIVSVLLDAGAGPDWSYRTADGDCYDRSEGLALASLQMYVDGVFSAHPERPLRVDAAALAALTPARLAAALQSGPDNPLVGLDGRTELLRRLARVMQDSPGYFGAGARLGVLFDRLYELADGARLPAQAILAVMLDAFGAIWPDRLTLGGIPLGDVWRHPLIRTNDPSDGLVPFHKLLQWLSYSLVEPLEETGINVTRLDHLTGLPEYRNGGLFLDLGVLEPRHEGVLAQPHRVDSEIVVEWRALTVILLDRLAERIRLLLGRNARTLPLARVLEGGSWAAGRKIAREKRSDGNPPLTIISDGTVF